MEYEDRVSISTPEGIEIELALAGLGSRLSAPVSYTHLTLPTILRV